MDNAGTESGTTGASASTDGQASTVINVCLCCHEIHFIVMNVSFSVPNKFII